MENVLIIIAELQKQVADLQKQVAELSLKGENKVDENWWSIEDYYNNILIKFSTGQDFHEFKDYIKELGGSFNGTKKAWKFPKIASDGVIKSISERFQNKEFKDLRT